MKPLRVKCMACRRGVLLREDKDGMFIVQKRCPVCHRTTRVLRYPTPRVLYASRTDTSPS